MTVAGVINVFDKPMYVGRSVSEPKPTVNVMPMVHTETLPNPERMNAGYNHAIVGAYHAMIELNTAATAPTINIVR